MLGSAYVKKVVCVIRMVCFVSLAGFIVKTVRCEHICMCHQNLEYTHVCGSVRKVDEVVVFCIDLVIKKIIPMCWI